MAARGVVTVYDVSSGKASGESLPLPAVFSAPIRRDIVHFVHYNMAKNARQAYAVSKYAGHQVSARSWGTGRAVARIPRVRGSGTHRTGQGAFGNMCRGGRMFAPTRTWRKWHRKISKNQRRFATVSALAASAIPALVMARGHRISELEEVPFVVSNTEGMKKVKDAIAALQAFGAFEDVEKAKDSKQLRRGAGKARNRRFVMRRGPLVVHSGEKNVELAFRNLPGVEVCDVARLNLLQLAPGGHMGRFVVWTKAAFEQLDAIYGSVEQASERKSGYTLPRAAMSTADLARIINSEEVQAVVRPAKDGRTFVPLKRNPLRNRGAMAKLNPYSVLHRRKAILEQQSAADRRQARRAARTAESRARSAKFLERLQADEWTA